MNQRSHKLFTVLLALVALVIAACAAPVAPATDAGTAASEQATVSEGYAKPDSIVDTQWVADHLEDPNVRLIFVGGADDYAAGHIPGAIYLALNELTNPEDATRGQILTQDALSDVMSSLGIENDDTIVFYDGNSNLLATRAYWAVLYYQHPDVRVYNGGSTKWAADGQELSTEPTELPGSTYTAGEADPAIRTTTEYVLEHLDDPGTVLCDARNPEEFAGTDVRSERGGHVPGAINVEWVHAVQDDGTFKSATDLHELYTKAGFDPDKEIITYCQTGVRGAHTWFVLSELLGYPNVRNYDGSWEEYGNRDDTPIDS